MDVGSDSCEHNHSDPSEPLDTQTQDPSFSDQEQGCLTQGTSLFLYCFVSSTRKEGIRCPQTILADDLRVRMCK